MDEQQSTKSQEDLARAFDEASRENRRLLTHAIRAEEDGFRGVARLLRAAAASTTVQARRFLTGLQQVGSTEENVLSHVEWLERQARQELPGSLRDARQESNNPAAEALDWAAQSDERLAGLMRNAWEHLRRGEDIAPPGFEVCSVCGYTADRAGPPDHCPECGSPQKAFAAVP